MQQILTEDVIIQKMSNIYLMLLLMSNVTNAILYSMNFRTGSTYESVVLQVFF